MKISVRSLLAPLALTLTLCRSVRSLTSQTYTVAPLAQIACYLTLKIIQLHYTRQHPSEYAEMKGKKKMVEERGCIRQLCNSTVPSTSMVAMVTAGFSENA